MHIAENRRGPNHRYSHTVEVRSSSLFVATISFIHIAVRQQLGAAYTSFWLCLPKTPPDLKTQRFRFLRSKLASGLAKAEDHKASSSGAAISSGARPIGIAVSQSCTDRPPACTSCFVNQSLLPAQGLSTGRGIQGKTAQNRAAASKSKPLSCICCRQLILPITILRAPLFRRNAIELP